MDVLFVSVNDAAKILNLGRTSIYQLIHAGTLETRKMGRRRVITTESIRRLADTGL